MQLGDTQTVIFDRGCLRSGEEWVERNLIPVAGVAVALAVLQVCLHFKYSVHFDYAQYVKSLFYFGSAQYLLSFHCHIFHLKILY